MTAGGTSDVTVAAHDGQGDAPDGNRTSDRILRAATGLFYEKGYHATSMREIASLVGIKAGSLYNHFGAKQDILFELAIVVMHEMLAGGQEAIKAAASCEDRIRALVEFHVRYSADHRLRAKVADEQLHALDEKRRRDVLVLRDRYEQLFRNILQEGRDQAGWQVDDIAVVTFAIGTMASAVNVWFREDGRLSASAVAALYGDLVLRAVGADPSRSPSQRRQSPG